MGSSSLYVILRKARATLGRSSSVGFLRDCTTEFLCRLSLGMCNNNSIVRSSTEGPYCVKCARVWFWLGTEMAQ